MTRPAGKPVVGKLIEVDEKNLTLALKGKKEEEIIEEEIERIKEAYPNA